MQVNIPNLSIYSRVSEYKKNIYFESIVKDWNKSK